MVSVPAPPKARRYLRSGETVRVLDIPSRTLDDWHNKGLVRTLIPSQGKGAARVYEFVTVWAVGVARTLRKLGFSHDVAGRVLEALAGLTHEDVEAALAEGRDTLFLMNGWPLPRLVRRDAVTENVELRQMIADAREAEIVTEPVAVDVRRVWDSITRAVGELDKPKQAKRAGAQ